MGDNIWLEDRNGVRTPMQWGPLEEDPTGGFSSNPNAKLYAPLISDPEYNNDVVNVKGTPFSILSLAKQCMHTF